MKKTKDILKYLTFITWCLIFQYGLINWINLINFIPSIFKEEEINKINNFYAKCDEVSDAAKALSEKTPYNTIYLDGKPMHEIPMPLNDINSHRNMFRKDLNELIEMGNEVKEIFE